MGEVFLDALIDTLWLLPVILIMHLVLEICEQKLFGRFAVGRVLLSPFAPLAGAVAGLVPQCGFSVVAADLYSARRITAGTLVAVLVATSDEALPVLLGSPGSAIKALPLIGLQLLLALIAGYSVQLILRFIKSGKKNIKIAESAHIYSKNAPLTEEENHAETHNITHDCACEEGDDHDCDHAHGENETTEENAHEKNRLHVCHGHTAEVEGFGIKELIVHTLRHTLTVIVFVFVVNLAMGLLLWKLGEDKLMNFLAGTRYAQPFVAALVGLIPNCAASVVVARMYALGGLTLGSALAGCGTCAGLAFAVLIKGSGKKSVPIIAGIYVLCSLAGLLTDLVTALL